MCVCVCVCVCVRVCVCACVCVCELVLTLQHGAQPFFHNFPRLSTSTGATCNVAKRFKEEPQKYARKRTAAALHDDEDREQLLRAQE